LWVGVKELADYLSAKSIPVDVLTISRLNKSYGPVQALKDVDLRVPEGSVYGILGPNGSGKTTLLSIILDVLKADKGDYRWFGQEGSPAIRKKIGSLLETPNFYHYLSGVNNLRITRSISERGTPRDIDQVLEKVKLSERKHSRFSTYSLGMKQRLAIAAALLGDPRVLVLDEPTNGLDPVGIAEMRTVIRNLRQQGFTIIIASHLLDEVEKICTHVAILKKGVLVAEGSVDEVLVNEDVVELASADLAHLESILAHYPGISRITREAEQVHLHFGKGKARPEDINSFCHSHGVPLSHLGMKKTRLETKFFELTGN